MDGAEWESLAQRIDKDGEWFQMLGNCLSVAAELRRWRESGDALAAGLAADALDQAVGMLESLVAGEAPAHRPPNPVPITLIELLRSALGELPPTIFD